MSVMSAAVSTCSSFGSFSLNSFSILYLAIHSNCYARTLCIGVSNYSLYATHYRASGRVYSQLESHLGTFRQS
jgi:hypothetical protein